MLQLSCKTSDLLRGSIIHTVKNLRAICILSITRSCVISPIKLFLCYLSFCVFNVSSQPESAPGPSSVQESTPWLTSTEAVQGQGDNPLEEGGISLLEGMSKQLLGRTCYHRPAFLVHKTNTLYTAVTYFRPQIQKLHLNTTSYTQFRNDVFILMINH